MFTKILLFLFNYVNKPDNGITIRAMFRVEI